MALKQIDAQDPLWPSGAGRAILTIDWPPEELADRFELESESGFDDLDYYVLAAAELPSGLRVAFHRHKNAPSRGTELWVDGDVDVIESEAEALEALGATSADLSWRLVDEPGWGSMASP